MSLSGNALIMREVNIGLVRKALKRLRQATKQQIAEVTGLSTVTVGTIIQQLEGANEVFEVDLAPSSGGRPAHQFRFNENSAYVLILFTHEQDGQDLLHIRVANLYGEVVKAQEVALEDIRLESFEPWIDACLKEYPSIRAIGFGLPGFDVAGKIIVLDYPALVGTRLTDAYTHRYHLPVIFENDVNAAAMGYCKRKSIQTEAAVIYAYFPKRYPPGAGIYLDGHLYKGIRNSAGEISSIPLGIDWLDPLLYSHPEQFCPAIANVVIAMCSLLNPHSVVLHGSFLTEDSIETIHKTCAARLPHTSVPNLILSDDFTSDYEAGMIAETLDCLEPQLSMLHSV
ncbi:MAG TPA: ROK family protein [Anaerolineaceae bacterium]|nr:ROK family protein [Anaerolineaceae bacterium]